MTFAYYHPNHYKKMKPKGPTKINGRIIKTTEGKTQRGNDYLIIRLSQGLDEKEFFIFSDLLEKHKDILKKDNHVSLTINEQLMGPGSLKKLNVENIKEMNF